MAKKKVAAVVKIQIPAGQATPAPPVGTALGPHGVAIMDFCKAYNAQTEAQRGTIVPVEITVFEDRSFTFITKTPPTPVLLREAARLEKGSQTPGRESVGSVTCQAGRGDRGDQDARPQRQRHRGGEEAGGRDRSVHGPRGGLTDHQRGNERTTPAREDLARASVTRQSREPDMAKGKKHSDATKRFDRDNLHTVPEAIDLVKSLASAGFDESVELAVRLGVDPRKADQMVRGTVALPSGTGKDIRVAVFANGPAAEEARAAGADIVGAEDLAAQVEGGMLDFDLAIATPDLMPLVGRLGRVLGPRGLMPNPKTGTVTADVGKAVEEFKGGKVEYRTDRYGNVHVPVGKASFERDALITNLRAVLDEVNRAKPASSKGRYIKRITISSTMGPGIKVDPNRIRPAEDEDAA